MGSESVVDEGHTFGRGVIGYFLRDPDPSYTSAIDLYVADASIVDQVLRHVKVVRTFTAREFDLVAPRRKRTVSFKRRRVEGLFEPECSDLLQGWQAGSGGVQVFAENLTDVNQKNTLRTQAFPRRHKLIDVRLEIGLSNRPPPKFHRAKMICLGLNRKLVSFFGRFPEQLRGVRNFTKSLAVSKQFPHRLAANFSQ